MNGCCNHRICVLIGTVNVAKLKVMGGNYMAKDKEQSKHFHAGWDHFTPAPGKEKEMFCRVCKEKMDVQRNVNGPTGWAEVMGKGKHLHDTFSCPHAQEDWHNQARILLERIQKETSRLIAKLLKKEVKQVLKTRKTTLKRYWGGSFL